MNLLLWKNYKHFAQVCWIEDSYIIRQSSHVTRIKQDACLRELGMGFFSGISSCKCQNFDMMKFQLSFVDCFTADVSVKKFQH